MDSIMEKVIQKIAIVQKALAPLERSVSRHKESESYEEERFEEYRDSLIQRFEYSLDLLWKVLKSYLEEAEGIVVASPKAVFRACMAARLLGEDEVRNFLEMIDARNTTSHTYREEFANLLYKQIPVHYHLMQVLVDRMGERLKQKV